MATPTYQEIMKMPVSPERDDLLEAHFDQVEREIQTRAWMPEDAHGNPVENRAEFYVEQANKEWGGHCPAGIIEHVRQMYGDEHVRP